MRLLTAALFAAIVCLVPALHAAEPAAETRPFDPAGISGSLVICGGGGTPKVIREKLVELAGGKEARLVIIPTAREEDEEVDDVEELTRPWKDVGLSKISFLHTRKREIADRPEFVEPLKAANAVWITGGKQGYLAGTYTGTLVERELHALLARGGVIGGTSAGAACMSRNMIIFGQIWRVPGFGLIPGTIVDQHFLARNRRDRLHALLGQQPSLVGFGVDEDTALVVQGRRLACIGNSTVTVCLGQTGDCECEDIVLKPGDVSDFTMYRRAALARLQPAFPPEQPAEPNVPQGALVIVGGGGMPAEVTEKFIELAGGPESLIVVLPTASGDRLPENPRDGEFLRKAGAKHVKVLKHRTRAEVESAEFLDTIREARGLWFGGGRQWRFVDAYEGTKAYEEFHELLRRGGVIGGSSAGATIQGDYLCRGSPLNNTDMLALGYERGFAFLPGVAIDQHFSQRKRFADMTALMEKHPQLLGIGIDESTALIVQGSTAEILGKNKAHFYDRRKPVAEGADDHESVAAGEKYDLARRRVVAPEQSSE
jgi:cyanophycinase